LPTLARATKSCKEITDVIVKPLQRYIKKSLDANVSSAKYDNHHVDCWAELLFLLDEVEINHLVWPLSCIYSRTFC